MSERSLPEIARQVQVDWTPARMNHVLATLATRRRQADRRRTGAYASLGAMGMLAVVIGALRLHEHESVAGNVATKAAGTLTTRDGSTVRVDPGSRVHAADMTDTRHTFVVDEGRASFSVTPNPARVFCVEAGLATVEVLGTVFDVTRDTFGTSVSVERGRVRVTCAGSLVVLGAGESTRCVEEAPSLPSAAAVSASASAGASAASHAAPPPASTTASTAHRVALHDAPSVSGTAPAEVVAPAREAQLSMRDVFVRADAMRAAGDAAGAARSLEDALARAPRDPAAATALFTLARIYDESLADRAQASRVFMTLVREYSQHPLAEDALAREAEAASRSGEPQRAAQLARAYREKYPSGVHAARMLAFEGTP